MNECEKTDDADILNLEAEFDAAAGAASPGIAVCALPADIANLSLSVGASAKRSHTCIWCCVLVSSETSTIAYEIKTCVSHLLRHDPSSIHDNATGF